VSAPQYNCSKCPGYCCSYPLIALDKRDVRTSAAARSTRPGPVCAGPFLAAAAAAITTF
jgi:hypothetical protein